MAISLTYVSLKVLIELILARGGDGSGFAPYDKMAISRCRAAVDQALGKGTGKKLIQTGSGEEYRLAIPKKKLRASVLLTSCFGELEEIDIVTEKEAKALRRICGKCPRKLEEKLLDGY